MRAGLAFGLALLCSFSFAPRSARADGVRMDELGRALAARIDETATAARTADAHAFWAEHGLDATRARVRDYVRVRTLFEMTRDGGPWRVRWAITNEEPSAKEIWAAWRKAPPAIASAAPSVTAECDEISALFAGLARRAGVRGVGLFWPTKDHTIAAWEPAPGVRVLVPTTQIYAGCDATFDRTPFRPTVQRTVFEFPERDVPDATSLPTDLASFLLDQVSHYAAASLDVLAAIRLHRAIALRSSVGPSCEPRVKELSKALRARSLGAADRRALVRYGVTELSLAGASPEDVLDRL